MCKRSEPSEADRPPPRTLSHDPRADRPRLQPLTPGPAIDSPCSSSTLGEMDSFGQYVFAES